MGLDLPLEVDHLVQWRVGYNPNNDTLTFLPFVADEHERANGAVNAYPVTVCETIEALYLRRNGLFAGVSIRHVRELCARRKQAGGNGRLSGFDLLEDAEERDTQLAPSDADMLGQTKALAHIRRLCKSTERLRIPPDILKLI